MSSTRDVNLNIYLYKANLVKEISKNQTGENGSLDPLTDINW